jgi:hypothetical protein
MVVSGRERSPTDLNCNGCVGVFSRPHRTSGCRRQKSASWASSSCFVGIVSRFGPLAVDRSISSSLSNSYIMELVNDLFSAPFSPLPFLRCLFSAPFFICKRTSLNVAYLFTFLLSALFNQYQHCHNENELCPSKSISVLVSHTRTHHISIPVAPTVTRQSPANMYKGWPGSQVERRVPSTSIHLHIHDGQVLSIKSFPILFSNPYSPSPFKI